MSLKKMAAIAVTLSLILAQNLAAVQPRPISIVPQTEFKEVHVIYDSFQTPTPAPRPKALPTPTAKAVVKTETKLPSKSKRSIKGLASYYCCTNGYPAGGFYAAVGPKLRVALGGGYDSDAAQPWKGKTVTVCGSRGCERVKLIDWCQCYWKQDHEKVIDLYKGLFFHIGAERGRVTIKW